MDMINGVRALAQRPISFTPEIKRDSLRPLGDSALGDKVGKGQVLDRAAIASYTPEELDLKVTDHEISESDRQDFVAASKMPGNEAPNDLVFDPGAWEKHANVLVAAIIALNIARVTNAELRGHFSIMAADAAKSQGAAIVETGKAGLYSAITGAVVSGAIAGFAMVKTFQGQGLKHADINLHKRNSLDANNIERDLKRDRASDDWSPDTTHKIKVFDDFGRSKTVDFKPEGATLTAKEQAWFDAEMLKAQKVGQTSDWLSQMGSGSIEKKLEIGRALNAMSMSLSQVMSSIVRMDEFAARAKETLQQSAQNTQKSLSDEVGQKDSADAALLQKLMDIVMQLFQSRIEVIGALTRA
ncbi:IpaC/SipC family type III secretion system effector [Pseudomonas sp. QTF5]|uniref:IpaC/SipC family type III secretion system effector n=1 Tax=Pseudomonas sp. QTF5 TaxID=1435425 RepID=UPI0004BAEBEC|nr:IpaC/SipC family type III secretion system effector [Pseudomonas sp. QTF5]